MRLWLQTNSLHVLLLTHRTLSAGKDPSVSKFYFQCFLIMRGVFCCNQRQALFSDVYIQK